MKIADIRFLLMLAVILVATVFASGCEDNGNNVNDSVLFQRTITRDNETLTYLKAMQAWQTKWQDNYWINQIRDNEDNWNLIKELLTITPPRSMEPEHDDYVLAHRLWLNSEKDSENWELLQEKYYSEEDFDSEFIGTNFESGDWEQGIPEYIQAQKVNNQCFQYMSVMEARYEVWYFYRLDKEL